MSSQQKFELLYAKQEMLSAKLAIYEKMFQGKIPMPKLWALDGKIGKHSVKVVGNKIVFDDNAADPTAAGDLARNGVNMRFHDGTSPKTLGSAGTSGFWQELGRTELSVAATTITVNPIAAKRWLTILIYTIGDGINAMNHYLFFNNDTANNNAVRRSLNGAVDETLLNRGYCYITDYQIQPQYSCLIVRNIATKEKLVIGENVNQVASGAGTAPGRYEVVSKWVNTTDQITRVDVKDGGGLSFSSGSIVIVLGND